MDAHFTTPPAATIVPTDLIIGESIVTNFARGRCIIVMGASASRKSSVAQGIQEMLPAWTFVDADPFHPPGNMEKIRNGVKITDEERAVFVDRLLGYVRDQRAIGGNFILSWSALRAEHRSWIREIIPDARFVYLHIDPDVALARSHARKAADASAPGPGIVSSQFDSLQIPSRDEALHLDALDPVIENTFRILRSYVEDGLVLPDEIGVVRRPPPI